MKWISYKSYLCRKLPYYMNSHHQRVRIKLQLILKLVEPEVALHHIDFDFAQFSSIVSIKRLND